MSDQAPGTKHVNGAPPPTAPFNPGILLNANGGNRLVQDINAMKAAMGGAGVMGQVFRRDSAPFITYRFWERVHLGVYKARRIINPKAGVTANLTVADLGTQSANFDLYVWCIDELQSGGQRYSTGASGDIGVGVAAQVDETDEDYPQVPIVLHVGPPERPITCKINNWAALADGSGSAGVGGGDSVTVYFKWGYGLTEVRRKASDGSWETFDGSLEIIAYNLSEQGNTAKYQGGVDVEAPSYPDTFRMLPIGAAYGDQLDEGVPETNTTSPTIVHVHRGTKDDGTIYYWFDRPNTHHASECGDE